MHTSIRSMTSFLAPLIIITACGAQPAPNDVAYPRIYRYTYEYNTPTLVEDHYIVLDSTGGAFRGRYFGTTDDFDPGREGYLPGFFVATMDELRITGDSIAFEVRPRVLFASPVPLQYRDPADVPPDFQKWTGPSIGASKSYSGTVNAEEITLMVDRRPRVFLRQDTR